MSTSRRLATLHGRSLSPTRTGFRSRRRSPSRRRALRGDTKSTSASITQASDAKPTCCASTLVIYCAASCRHSGGQGFVRHLRQEVLPVAFAQTGHTHRASRALAYTRLCVDQLARRVPNTYTQTAAQRCVPRLRQPLRPRSRLLPRQNSRQRRLRHPRPPRRLNRPLNLCRPPPRRQPPNLLRPPPRRHPS